MDAGTRAMSRERGTDASFWRGEAEVQNRAAVRAVFARAQRKAKPRANCSQETEALRLLQGEANSAGSAGNLFVASHL